jgi:GNAT superfamily N-acetyltransferase
VCRSGPRASGPPRPTQSRRVAPKPPPPAAVLKHVVVDPDFRGDGTGASLVEAFVEQARRRGAERARLTTLHDEAGAEEFWAGLGWVAGGVVADADQRRHRVFTLNL